MSPTSKLPVSTRRLVACKTKNATYHLRTPTQLDRGEIEAAVLTLGIRPIATRQVRSVLRAAISRNLEDSGPYIEALDRIEAGEGNDVDVGMMETAEILVSSDEAYARTLAMQARWSPHYRWQCVKRLVVKRNDEALELEGDVLSDKAMDGLSNMDIEVLGYKAMELMTLDDSEIKNSESPSQSRAPRKASAAAKNPQTEAAGK